ncbi:putative chromate transport protein [Pigmentiphaga humi]|uniref:Putative chromate transport protein n=1 Tax=Pigmentiphaga humi TaxID=2478468 RepID=A0A3P4B4J9_9BURK|nr:chromate transporter [Pigmentiphaga humi]VCU71227.1 putative chromate transport protein [Pigmentiphaga humi]
MTSRPQTPPPDLPPVPSISDIFVAFMKIGLTSFGGGLSGWMLREFVQRRRWLSESEFLSGLALAQAFPGVNVINLAIWLGFRLRGGCGALVGALGLVLPTMALALVVVGLFAAVAKTDSVHVALAGVAAAAVGLSLQTGLRAASRAARSAPSVAVLVITFCGIFLLRLPLLWVVGAMAPLSILMAYLKLRASEAP